LAEFTVITAKTVVNELERERRITVALAEERVVCGKTICPQKKHCESVSAMLIV
jgi:hypothetical protein